MKSKITLLLFAFFLGISTSVFSQIKEIRPSDSTIKWIGKKTNGQHKASLKFVNGHLQMENGTITGGEFLLDMTELVVTGLVPGNGKERLEGHLYSENFFDVRNHKTATLIITDVEKNGNDFKMKGNLTLKGKTNPVSFNLALSGDSAATKVMVNPAEYGFTNIPDYVVDNQGDKLVYDDFELDMVLKM